MKLMSLAQCLFADWRHVLGADDAIDGIDIALGKCTMAMSFAFYVVFHHFL